MNLQYDPLDLIQKYYELCSIEVLSPHLLSGVDLSILFNKHEISVFFDVQSTSSPTQTLIAKCGSDEPTQLLNIVDVPISETLKPSLNMNMVTDYVEVLSSQRSNSQPMITSLLSATSLSVTSPSVTTSTPAQKTTARKTPLMGSNEPEPKCSIIVI